MATILAAKQRAHAKVISAADIRPGTLPKSLYEAAGLLRHRKKALEAHLKRVRNEWS
ncbi:MAG: hypothetical protein AAB386_01640 [Patescibacteria group bacterium]